MDKIIYMTEQDVERKYNSLAARLSNSSDNTELKGLKLEGLYEIFKVINSYLYQGFDALMVMDILDKKFDNLINSHNQEEINDAVKLSTCRFTEKGVVVNKNHIPAEELILLQIASNIHPLNQKAQKRYRYLYRQCFGGKRGLVVS
ncbi:MAG: hypothetical protein IJ365_02410 [Clostridia bacterium]|nr:hypothetical protein [Clostridia bacterium]